MGRLGWGDKGGEMVGKERLEWEKKGGRGRKRWGDEGGEMRVGR